MNKRVILFLFLQCMYLVPHGFVGSTLVGLYHDQNDMHISKIAARFFSGQKTDICTYKEKAQKWKKKKVQAVAYCQSEVSLVLTFSNQSLNFSENIQCSPLQLFYRISDKTWMQADQFHEGDQLLCKNNQIVRLQSKQCVQESVKLYIIEVKKHHTFAVGRQKILTHNMFIPIATTIGFAIPFDILFNAGSFGCMFGPVTFCCSIAVAGIAAGIVYTCGGKKHTDFILNLCEKSGNFEIQPYKNSGCFIEQPAPDGLILYNDNNNAGGIQSVEDILSGAKEQGNTGGISKIYVKPGTIDDMIKDFDSLELEGKQDFKDSKGKDGKIGYLPDGRKVTVRITSTDERSTLDIENNRNSTGKKIIKIRYDNTSNNKT